MTVQELIEKLKEYDPSMRVVIDGYEGGLNDANKFEIIKLLLDENENNDYFGRHGYAIFDEEYDCEALRLCYEEKDK